MAIELVDVESCPDGKPWTNCGGGPGPVIKRYEPGETPPPDADHPALTGFDGSRLWAELRAIEIRDGETFEAAARRVVESIDGRLPCGICKDHWLAMLDRTPPDYDYGSPPRFRRWVDARQNEVNVSLGRPEWTAEQSDQRWGKVEE